MLRNTHIAQERFGPHEDWFLSRGEREKQATPILLSPNHADHGGWHEGKKKFLNPFAIVEESLFLRRNKLKDMKAYYA